MLERNTIGIGHTTAYRLDNVTIEVDLSEAGYVDESLAEGLPVSVEGHFETQDTKPGDGRTPWFKAHSLRQELAGGGGPLSGPPPPS